ncbi:tRNA (adenosine(37)-N6)-dimethylallyltransferase MiaA [Allosphingosinicella sp.]|uniref:tRNA (adenosine(37)-N6)-dimethylallyltransferase MiaA n=1 Tax=Allosphingosinicella sp. TaxID=2823234 RepID=UPI003D7659E4
MNTPLPALALIAGPTASGKSALALALAERTGGVVINADSAQVYRDLRVLTARPSPEEEARAPHQLYGYRDGAEPCSAADWAADAKQAIAGAHAAGSLPILVGGTGLYIRTLLDGIAPVPPIDANVRAEVRALPVDEAHRALAREDPEAAARLRPTDTSRVARALEVIRSTSRALSEWHTEKVGGIGESVALRPLLLLPPRQWLYERCDRRFEAMLGDAGLEELRALLARGLDPALPVMRAIGVPEIAGLLLGDLTREQALAAGRTATRQYAKRQYTWFSRQPPAQWPRFAEPLDGIAFAAALSLLNS